MKQEHTRLHENGHGRTKEMMLYALNSPKSVKSNFHSGETVDESSLYEPSTSLFGQ